MCTITVVKGTQHSYYDGLFQLSLVNTYFKEMNEALMSIPAYTHPPFPALLSCAMKYFHEPIGH